MTCSLNEVTNLPLTLAWESNLTMRWRLEIAIVLAITLITTIITSFRFATFLPGVNSKLG